jgi:hypothetical protein
LVDDANVVDYLKILQLNLKHFALSEASRACGSLLGLYNIGDLIFIKVKREIEKNRIRENDEDEEEEEIEEGVIMPDFGNDVSKLIETILPYFETLAKNNMPMTTCTLGLLLYEEKKYTQANYWFHRSMFVENDDIKICCHYSDSYHKEKLLEKDGDKVEKKNNKVVVDHQLLCDIIEKSKCGQCAKRYLETYFGHLFKKDANSNVDINSVSFAMPEEKDIIFEKLCYYFHLVGIYHSILFEETDMNNVDIIYAHDVEKKMWLSNLSIFYSKFFDKIDLDKEYRSVLSIISQRLKTVATARENRREFVVNSGKMNWVTQVLVLLLTRSSVAPDKLNFLTRVTEGDWIRKTTLSEYIPCEKITSIIYDFLFLSLL